MKKRRKEENPPLAIKGLAKTPRPVKVKKKEEKNEKTKK